MQKLNSEIITLNRTVTKHSQILEKENQELKEQISNMKETYKHIMSGEYIPANVAEKTLKLNKQSIKEERENLQQLYSHLGVEAFCEDIQEQAVKEIDKLKQSQKELAINELEKTKNLACSVIIELDYTARQINNFLGSQIKKLKEGK